MGRQPTAYELLPAMVDKHPFDEILAKHDENYMAPEVADSLAEHVQDQTLGLAEGPAECPNGDT